MLTTKFKLLAVILIIFTLPGIGQQTPSPPSPSSTQEDAPVLGMDISHYQGKIDWDQVKKNKKKITFVIVKATEGTDDVDPRFKENWQGAKQAGILRGAYHFFDAKQDAKTQANFFINTVKILEENDLPPWLDLESDKFDQVDEVPLENFIDSVLIWLETVENGLGTKPIIYTAPYFARDYLTDIRFSRYALATADYGTISAAPRLLGAWLGTTWTFWQYTSRGKVKGIDGNIDLDKFNGSTLDIYNLIKNSRKKEIEALPPTNEPLKPPAMEKKKETTPKSEPEIPVSKKEKEPATPTVETTGFSKEIHLGNIHFPRDFIQEQIPYKKGVFQVKLVLKQKEDTFYFYVYDRDNRLLFKEMAAIKPGKGNYCESEYQTMTGILDNEYFMIKVTTPEQHIYAFFLIKE